MHRRFDPCKGPRESWAAFLTRRQRETSAMQHRTGRVQLADLEELLAAMPPADEVLRLRRYAGKLRRRHPNGCWVELPLRTIAQLVDHTLRQPPLFPPQEARP